MKRTAGSSSSGDEGAVMKPRSVPWGPSLGVAAVLATSASGCFWATTKSEGQALRRDVTSLEQRVSAKEVDLTGKVDEVKRVLDEATKLLKRNSADLGA